MTTPGSRIPDVEPALLARACAGDLAALDAVLRAIEPGVFTMAVRMLGHREDARDATQDVLVRVATHLAGFRGDAAFSTWVFRIARNVIVTASTRAREAPEVSLEALGERLGAGLAHADAVGWHGGTPERPLTPLERIEARDVARHCTQGMLLALDRAHRLAYVLDVVFGLDSLQGAAVLEISREAYRQRVSRARARLHDFMEGTCGLASAAAPCRCARQLPAVRLQRAAPAAGTGALLPEVDAASLTLEQLEGLFDAASVMRAEGTFDSTPALATAVRGALAASGWLDAE